MCPVVPGRPGQGAELGAGCRVQEHPVLGAWGHRAVLGEGWQGSTAVQVTRTPGQGGQAPLEPGAGCLEDASPRGAGVYGEVGRVCGMEVD